ncbi:MAG: response regulator [Myxococcota bacterium]
MEQSASGVVLFVDDELELLEGLEQTLRKSPYSVLTAVGVQPAFDILSRQPVDVLVSDEKMPGMCGSEFLTRVAGTFPGIVRMVLTGHASVEAAIMAINGASVFRYLTKPCLPDALRRAVDEAFEERKRTQAPCRTHLAGLTGAERRSLSPREQEVLGELALGYRVPEVAKRLFISPHTVRNHIKSLFRKLELHSQAELARRARGV